VQYHEENSHALKFVSYIHERQGEVTLQPIEAVPLTWKSVLEVMEKTYEHECKVTEMIYNCVNVAEAEKDRASVSFLHGMWTNRWKKKPTPTNRNKLAFFG
jgi:ferritin